MEKFNLKVKEYLDKLGNKKLIYNLFIILIIGIILLITANIFLDKGDGKEVDNPTDPKLREIVAADMDYSIFLESKLEEILMELKGVGQVKVMITLEDTMEKIPAFNTSTNNEVTSEIDSQGGTREITREDMDSQVVTGADGGLMVLKEMKPTVRGVIVIAEGAEDMEIKETLYEAVKTVLGISGNKVEVYSRK